MRGRDQTAIQLDMVVLQCINLVRMCAKMGKVQVILISVIFLLGSFGVTCQADLHHYELKSASWRTFFHSSKSDRSYVAPESGESKHMTENARGAVKFNALRTKSHGSSKRAEFASSSQVIRTDLVHRDHVSSPLRPESGSKSELFAASVKRSFTRQQRIARSIRLGPPNAQVESTVAAGDGEYLMKISLGTPPQTFIAIVDTGSDLVWVQCWPCRPCYRQDGPMFIARNSSSYTPMSCRDELCVAIDSDIYSCVRNASCRYEYRYGDLSSTSGDFVYDVLTFNNFFDIPHFAFGCGHSNRGNFDAVGGLVGLGLGSFSLPSQINDTVPEVFSYCLLSTYPASTKTSPLFFGEVPPITNIVYTPLIQNPANPTFYYVGLQGISLNGQQLFIPIEAFMMDSSGDGGVIMDSGTTLTLLNERAYNVLLQSVRLVMPYPTTDGSVVGLDLCYNVSGIPGLTLPTLYLHFMGGADYYVPGEGAFVYADEGHTMLCFAVASAGSGFSIIGNIMQQNHAIVYDRVNNLIGWANMACETL